jgi:hypothetical protein
VSAATVSPRDHWHAVDRHGRDLATGRAPSAAGFSSAAAAVAAAPVVDWPLAAVADDGRRRSLGMALGAGGAAVERLLDRLLTPADGTPAVDVASLAPATPTGRLDLPLAVVDPTEGVERSADVDPAWLAAVDRRRAAARPPLLAAGRADELEAALHVAMLVATDVLDPTGAGDVDAHVASGAQLWLLGGAVAWSLAGGGRARNPFGPWAELVTAGWWPVGPSRGELVVAVVPR